MKILVASLQVPYPLVRGSSLCFYNIFKWLAERNEIHFISFKSKPEDEDNISNYESLFKSIQLVEYDARERSAFRYLRNIISWNSGFLLKEQQPHIYKRFRDKIISTVPSLQIELIYCHLLDAFEFIEDIKSVPRVLHVIDSRSLALQRKLSMSSGVLRPWKLFDLAWYYRVKKYESLAIRKSDLTVTVGKKDYEVLKSMAPDANIHYIPLGVDFDYFASWPHEKEEYPSLVFTGTMNFPPNVDAVIYFYEEIFPLIRARIPEVKFFVVGAYPPEEIKKLSQDRSVIVTGFVDDIRSFMGKSSLAVCPMRIGGGMKIKILEAMAIGKAVVSTSIGAEGLDVENGKNIVLADTAEEFADMTIRMLEDASFRQSIARDGQKLAETSYSWDRCSMQHERLYSDLLRNNS